jgi:unsaturated rhamnogalacturonyl hydrolase
MSHKIAATIMTKWKDSLSRAWTYDNGVILTGIERVWRSTGDPKYFGFIQKNMDRFIDTSGEIRTYKLADYNIDNVLCGRQLLLLHAVTGKEQYLKAATTLREQLKGQPRTKEGGFWHKKRYPYQMWLDGLYMGEPFYTEYTKTFGVDTAFNDIANQFIWMEKHSRDVKTGLLYHAWDESKEQKWANKTTGQSPNFWGRAMGWYAMALADVLDHFPKNHPRRPELIAIYNRLATAIVKVQDKPSGVWWQVLNMGDRKGNYLEASASSMFTYALAKGVRLGYLPASFKAAAQRGYDGILKTFISTDDAGLTHLNRVCQVAGLGGDPYRDGSFEYYIGEPIITDDPKGIGAFLQAAAEMEIADKVKIGAGKKLLLDNYFNHETKKDAVGNTVPWHYTWNDQTNGGYSFLGGMFTMYGVDTTTLTAAPTAANLKGSSIYLIVDPDTQKETPQPNYIEEAHVKVITDWVKAGGVLVLLGNDTGNVEMDHFNTLVKPFGIQFNKDSRARVQRDNYPDGAVAPEAGNEIFKTAKQLYIKEYSSLTLAPPAKAVLKSKDGYNMMAVAKLGKGTVFALGDPWIYNEYLDGRKLPLAYENFKGANDWVQWLIAQTKK